MVVFVNAARKVGAVSVPLNYRLSDDEAEYVTDHCDATLVYVDAAHAPLFERIRERLAKVSTYLVYDAGFAGLAVPEGLVDADELVAAASPEATDGAEPGATMIYTSGTTGKPKGALRQGVGNPAQVGAMVQHIGYTPDDVYLTTGPLYHSGPGASWRWPRRSARPLSCSTSSIRRTGCAWSSVTGAHPRSRRRRRSA